MTGLRYPPQPPPDIELEGGLTTGREVFLGIVAVLGGLAAVIGLSFASSIFIAPWAGIVIPLVAAVFVIAVIAVVIATKENGW